ncbi:hypothetical protein G6F24_017682 [Rhizopus arrhizus]|nr:hypothetical protein G6F24_017682 [Rhizopus arrhizus]
MAAHFLGNLRRNHRRLGCQHRADAERRRAAGAAGRPVVHFDHRAHQIRLAGEMVMDAGLADVDPRRHVGIAETVVAAGLQQRTGVGQDLQGLGRERLFHMPQPTSR